MNSNPVIRTVKDRCKVCYTCVRECPARAIKIINGQAEIIDERCISCGNCTIVCKQDAKQFYNSIEDVLELIKYNKEVVACIAPSFPAEFNDIPYKQLIGMIKQIGFTDVFEVGFGADLVARKTVEYLNNGERRRYIGTSCPAIVKYIETHNPNIVKNLVPVVSPMIATARVIKQIRGEEIKIVFIGPCTAKKAEANSPLLNNEISAALTFIELRELFDILNIKIDKANESDFAEPQAGKGTLFPLSGGMIQSVNLTENYIDEIIVNADGKTKFIEAIKEFTAGDLNAKLLDLLCCNGCISGAGMACNDPYFNKRSKISRYTREVIMHRDKDEHEKNIDTFLQLDLSRVFAPNDQRISEPTELEIRKILSLTGKNTQSDELNCGACGYHTCRELAVAIHLGYAEKEMCLPFTVEYLHKTVQQLADTNSQLQRTRKALVQTEKLATMGQLSAGIAHELNNPLGAVIMYANLLLEEMDKNKEHWQDIQIIAQEANRCKSIISGLLNFARQNDVNLQKINIIDMINHCMLITKLPDEVNIKIKHNMTDPMVEIDQDQMIQVLVNLINNAVTAMDNKGTLTISTEQKSDEFCITVEDTGKGIASENLPKIFRPFFTTKNLGKGTGLGLAITYGIIKMHKGNIKVISNNDISKGSTGTKFIISLPRFATNENKILSNNNTDYNDKRD